ncbi:MAG: tyrosine-type recombinase/integrase [Candidatus Thermoplasmatota archaeon]|nr:tyrosine-type recombinase/integrase [Candidatus Thermoplasmatota archaeon]
MPQSGYTDVEIEKFRSWMIGERKSRHTVKEYSFLVKHFLSFLNVDPQEIGKEEIENYKKFTATVKGYSRNSQYLAIKAIKLYFRYKGIAPPPNLNPPVRSKKLPNYLNEAETRGLIIAGKAHPKFIPIIMTLAYTGIRVGELCSLDLKDVDLEENTIRIRGGKGDKDRIVIMSRECSASIREYIDGVRMSANTTAALFVSSRGTRYDPSTIERIVRRIREEAGISKKVTPHVLRHTFATSLLRNGGDIRFIQQILGHASVATTQIYTHVDDGMLKDMYLKYQPKY